MRPLPRIGLSVVGLAIGVACGDFAGEMGGDVPSPAGEIDPSPDTGIAGVDDPDGPWGDYVSQGVNGCNAGLLYAGFGGVQLNADRVDAEAGLDRLRMKPYSSLPAEYLRVLGKTPSSITGQGATFGEAGARWFEEAQSSAVRIDTSYRAAFQGCLDTTLAPPQYGSPPDAVSGPIECSAFARKFWSRTMSSDELATCASFAANDTVKEANARRRWAYVCATVLTASGFLTF